MKNRNGRIRVKCHIVKVKMARPLNRLINPFDTTGLITMNHIEFFLATSKPIMLFTKQIVENTCHVMDSVDIIRS